MSTQGSSLGYSGFELSGQGSTDPQQPFEVDQFLVNDRDTWYPPSPRSSERGRLKDSDQRQTENLQIRSISNNRANSGPVMTEDVA